MKKLVLFLLLIVGCVFGVDPSVNNYNIPSNNTFSHGLNRIGDYPYPTDPMLDRAKGYLLRGKAKSVILNYGNFISWDESPAGGWGNYSYLPNLSFIAGIAGQAYSSDFTWINSSFTISDGISISIWESTDAYDAWFEDADFLELSEGRFKTVVYDVNDGKGQIATYRENIENIVPENGVQWSVDFNSESIIIYFDEYLTDLQNGPNYSNQRVGLAYPWAIRPKLKERLDDFDFFDYGEDLEEWTEDDDYMYYGSTFQESYFTVDKTKSDWQPVSKSREDSHNLDVTAGDLFGETIYTDISDSYPLLAHSKDSETWPKAFDFNTGEHEPFWPGWWADTYWGDSPNSWPEMGITDCNGTRQDDDCWKQSVGSHVSDMDIFMQFDDRWAFRGNQVENNIYLQTGYPLGLRVMNMAHSYEIAYAEDIMFFTMKVRNESGDNWCAFERDESNYKVAIYDDDGNQVCGEGMIMADGTILNAGKGFDYEKLSLGFYMDADVLTDDLTGSMGGVHSNDDDFMEYIDCEIPSQYYPDGTCKYINGEKLRVSMATIYDYDGQSGQPGGESIGMVAVQLLDSPKATKNIDLDQDGFIDIEIGEPLKMTDWHWFDWYNRPGVVNTESNQNAKAGSSGGAQAANKEEINYKIMSGDTTNLSDDEKRRYFHTSDPSTDLDILLNPHFDSLEGLAETEFFTRDPDGLDCVLEMSSGPFDLEVGEQVSFSFCVIFGQNHTDLIRNAEFAQIMYNAHYQGYTPPIKPKVSATVSDHEKITVYWTNEPETSIDVVTTYSDFEGYKIYKSRDNGSTWGNPSQTVLDDEAIHVGWQPYAQFDLSALEDSAFCILGFDEDQSGECKTTSDCDPCVRNREFSGPDPMAPWFSLGENTGFDAVRLTTPKVIDGIAYENAFVDSNKYDDNHNLIEENIIEGGLYTYSVVAYDIGVPAIEDPGNWGLQNPSPYLENAKGTTILDRNFVTVNYSSPYGCTDQDACNFEAEADFDDSSCIYPEENEDCDGNCTAGEDCAGECGGSAEVDECGVCGGDGITDGACDCVGNIDLGCGCGAAGPSGCDNQCGSILENDECGECGGDGIAVGKCDCIGNVEDCAGECGGSAVVDVCFECGGNGWDDCDDDDDGKNNKEQYGYGAYGLSVKDIPIDQGGYVYLSFTKSFYDTDTLSTEINDDSDWANEGVEFYTIQRKDDELWISLQPIAAYGSKLYTTEVRTLSDSTSTDNALTEFRVIAAMIEGNFVSIDTLTGYSVDNIAPETPSSLSAIYDKNENKAVLSWDPSEAEDLSHYNIYRNTELHSTTTETSFIDEITENTEYTVSAVDIHENESGMSESVQVSMLNVIDNLIPKEYVLMAAYPNPFNPITNIIYGLPEYINVQIIVYDLSGKHIETLVNKFQAPGYHSVDWNADNHTSGVYFVKIVAGRYISTKKLMLVK